MNSSSTFLWNVLMLIGHHYENTELSIVQNESSTKNVLKKAVSLYDKLICHNPYILPTHQHA